MATALRSLNPKPPRDRRSASRRSARPNLGSPLPHHSAVVSPVRPLHRPIAPGPSAPRSITPRPATNIRQLPSQAPIPQWLRMLMRVQRGSTVITLILGAAALVVYSSAIFVQQQWSKDYQKLKSMQRSERQMIAAGEFLKNQIIQQAEQPGSGLVPKSSAHMLYLEPAPERSPVETQTNPVQMQSESAENEDLTGY
jgi:hypothetical protein